MSQPDPSESLPKSGSVYPIPQTSNTIQSPGVHLLQSELFHNSNISLNDSGVGISPLTPRATVFTFDTVEIEQHIRESVSSVQECDEENEDDLLSEDPELARIVNSFASISSNPSESERIRPSAPMNCLRKDKEETDDQDKDAQNSDDSSDGDDGSDDENNGDDENDDVFLNDLEAVNAEEDQQRINNYLLARINRVEHHLSLQYRRRNIEVNGCSPADESGRSSILRTRLGGLQIRCQKFVKRILGMALPGSNPGSSLTPFGIEREFIERMTINAANNEENIPESTQSTCHASSSNMDQIQRTNPLPDVVPNSSVLRREVMRNMARKERLQRNSCHRSASFAAPSSSSSDEWSIENRRTMSVSFPIEATSLTAVARQLREISIDFSAKNQTRTLGSFGSLYPVFDLLANTFIETTRRVSRVTRSRTFAAPSSRSQRSNPDTEPQNSFPNLQNHNQQPQQSTFASQSQQHSQPAHQPSITSRPRPPTPQPSSSSIAVSEMTANSRGRVINNSRFYTTLAVTESVDSSSQFVAKCHEENNNEY